MSRRVRPLVAVSGVLVVGVCVAVAAAHGPPKQALARPPRAAATTASATPDTPTVPVVRQPEEACGGERFNPRAVRAYRPGTAGYTGAGVHFARLFPMYSPADPEQEPELPTAWSAAYNPREDVQLVVCVWEDDTFAGRMVKVCRYEELDGKPAGAADLYSARYVYRVFEARTGRPITWFTLRGTVNTCPGVRLSRVSGAYRQAVSSHQLAARLHPIILARLPVGRR